MPAAPAPAPAPIVVAPVAAIPAATVASAVASALPSGPFHIVRSRTHINRRLKSLEEVVGQELGAPYTCQLIPQTREIVLTPEKESASRATEGTDPMRQDRMCGMALLITPPIADGGPIPHTASSNRRTRPNVYDTLRQPAQPAARPR